MSLMSVPLEPILKMVSEVGSQWDNPLWDFTGRQARQFQTSKPEIHTIQRTQQRQPVPKKRFTPIWTLSIISLMKNQQSYSKSETHLHNQRYNCYKENFTKTMVTKTKGNKFTSDIPSNFKIYSKSRHVKDKNDEKSIFKKPRNYCQENIAF